MKLARVFLFLCLAFSVPAGVFADGPEETEDELVAIGEAAKASEDTLDLDIPPANRAEVESSKAFRDIIDIKGSSKKTKTPLSEEARALRPRALEDVATRLGFQEGYFYRYKQIQDILRKRRDVLDTVFDFGPFLLEGGRVMPPVITRADSYAEIKGPDEMVQTGTAYRILRPARFVTVKPGWRDYLVVPEGAVRPEKIHPSMLPMDSAEREIWKKAVTEQWFNGMEHADRMFQIGVNKMLTDLRGIIQYRVLERRGYVSMPQVASGHLAVRVGDENLEFDQQVFRITEKSRFKDIERETSSDRRPAKKTSSTRRKSAR